MTAAEIATALGAAHRSGEWWRCLCPVHGSRSGHSPTLAIRDGDRGLIVKCWAGCDRQNVVAELRRRRLIGERAPTPVPRGTDDAIRRIELAQRIWAFARNAQKSPVAAYLAARGITIALPSSLRWAPALRRPDGTHGPAMLARIDGADGELIGIQRTWISCDTTGTWRRDIRAMLGRVGGGAVRLAAASEVLFVGEGIETCLAAMQATTRPSWAALSTSGLVALKLPPIVRHVVILTDHDRSGAGERAARAAGAGWLAEGRRVRIAMPRVPESDFNDVLINRSDAEVHDVI
jgi:putative DNA primase/helicase